MKSKLKLFFALLLLVAFLAESCGGQKSAYQTPKKGKHSKGGRKIKTDMGGFL